MFRKVNNKLLGIILFSLLILAVIVVFFDSDKDERTFREVLVVIDTSAVTKLVINPEANSKQSVTVYKQNNKWFVELPNGKSAHVTSDKIEQSFNELTAIKPKLLVARGKDKWKDFKVDSAGTRVQVFEGKNISLDIVLGRFNYQQQPRNVSTYVRLYNDNDVYEVDGFLALTFNQDTNAFRDGTVIKSDYTAWKSIRLDYPADSSFNLIKINNKWFINNLETDSAKTVNYLRKLGNLSNNNFIDEVDISKDQAFKYGLTISDDNLNFIEVNAYIDSSSYVITSSQNEDTRFDGKTFGNTIFVGKASFLK